MIKKKFLYFFFYIFLVTSCTTEQEVKVKKKDIIIAENLEFPTFNNQELFIQATGIGIANFERAEKQMGLKSSKMFVCNGDNYFVKEDKYCIYFDGLWIQNPIITDSGRQLLALTSKEAYADKIFSDFLFNQATFTVQNLDFILFSSVVRWRSKENLLNSPETSTHTMKNKTGDILKGSQLFLDYKSQFFTMNHVTLDLQDDL